MAVLLDAAAVAAELGVPEKLAQRAIALRLIKSTITGEMGPRVLPGDLEAFVKSGAKGIIPGFDVTVGDASLPSNRFDEQAVEAFENGVTSILERQIPDKARVAGWSSVAKPERSQSFDVPAVLTQQILELGNRTARSFTEQGREPVSMLEAWGRFWLRAEIVQPLTLAARSLNDPWGELYRDPVRFDAMLNEAIRSARQRRLVARETFTIDNPAGTQPAQKLVDVWVLLSAEKLFDQRTSDQWKMIAF